jgi:ribonuclease HI
MNPAERNYGIHDRELLAIIHALEEWRAELQGLQRAKPFKIFTDHQALQYFMQKQRLNPQQA